MSCNSISTSTVKLHIDEQLFGITLLATSFALSALFFHSFPAGLLSFIHFCVQLVFLAQVRRFQFVAFNLKITPCCVLNEQHAERIQIPSVLLLYIYFLPILFSFYSFLLPSLHPHQTQQWKWEQTDRIAHEA